MILNYKDYVQEFRSKIFQWNIDFFRDLNSRFDLNHLLLNPYWTISLFALIFSFFNLILIGNHIKFIKNLTVKCKVRLYIYFFLDNAFIGSSRFLISSITFDIYQDFVEIFECNNHTGYVFSKIFTSFETIYKKIVFFIEEVFSSKIYFKW
ncbi:MAG: hypothetical protein ACRC4M_00470 [Mycoplasma sp.]